MDSFAIQKLLLSVSNRTPPCVRVRKVRHASYQDVNHTSLSSQTKISDNPPSTKPCLLCKTPYQNHFVRDVLEEEVLQTHFHTARSLLLRPASFCQCCHPVITRIRELHKNFAKILGELEACVAAVETVLRLQLLCSKPREERNEENSLEELLPSYPVSPNHDERTENIENENVNEAFIRVDIDDDFKPELVIDNGLEVAASDFDENAHWKFTFKTSPSSSVCEVSSPYAQNNESLNKMEEDEPISRNAEDDGSRECNERNERKHEALDHSADGTHCGTNFCSLYEVTETHQKESYKCSKCSMTFTRLTKLKFHEASAHPTEVVVDDEIELHDDQESDFHDSNSNSQSSSDSEHSPCPEEEENQAECDASLSETEMPHSPNKTQYPSHPTTCQVCQEEFISECKFENHFTLAHPGQLHYCPDCEKRYATLRSLRRHQVCHKPSGGVKCKRCRKPFSSLYYLKRHYKFHPTHKKASGGSIDSDGLSKESENGSDGKSVKRTAKKRKRNRRRLRTQPPKTYTCTLCPTNCKTVHNLEKHLTSSHPGKQHACRHCEKTFEKYSAVRRHTQLVHLDKGDFVCEECGQRLYSRHALEVHVKQHNESPQNCLACKETFPNLSSLQEHERVSHEGEERSEFVCTKCPAYFRTKYQLKHHKTKLHPTGTQTIHPCETCGKSFYNKKRFDTHIHKEEGQIAFKCPNCPKQYTDYNGLAIHLARKHKTETLKKQTKAQCDICGAILGSQKSLYYHAKRHAVGDPTHCDVCKQKFPNQTEKFKHDREVHGRKEPFKCYFCKKVSASRLSLEEHVRNHTMEGVMCPVCRKTLSSVASLNQHMIAVCGSDERKKEELRKKKRERLAAFRAKKIYKCDKCGVGFGQRAQLDSHLRKCL